MQDHQIHPALHLSCTECISCVRWIPSPKGQEHLNEGTIGGVVQINAQQPWRNGLGKVLPFIPAFATLRRTPLKTPFKSIWQEKVPRSAQPRDEWHDSLETTFQWSLMLRRTCSWSYEMHTEIRLFKCRSKRICCVGSQQKCTEVCAAHSTTLYHLLIVFRCLSQVLHVPDLHWDLILGIPWPLWNRPDLQACTRCTWSEGPSFEAVASLADKSWQVYIYIYA